VKVEGAKGVLFNVTGGETLTLFEVNEAAEIIRKAVAPEANIIFGVPFDASMENEIKLDKYPLSSIESSVIMLLTKHTLCPRYSYTYSGTVMPIVTWVC
jgi:hypothetical protein